MRTTMTFALFDEARLVEPCDGWGVEGDEMVRFEAGTTGAVIELGADEAELELVTDEGYTYGFVVARFDQLELVWRRPS